MTIAEIIFEAFDPTGRCSVPLTKYQEYTVRRFKVNREFDTIDDVGRFKALMWYIEAYSLHRRPMILPFSADQVRWLLTPNAPYESVKSLPRVVEAFQKRLRPDIDYLADDEDYADLAYWWCAELAPSVGIEQFAIPTLFISTLSKVFLDRGPSYALNSFTKRFMKARADVPWLMATPSERLASYVRVLMEPMGVHYGLFFPPDVLATLRALPASEAALSATMKVTQDEVQSVRRRAIKALEYRSQHEKLRSGKYNISAPIIGADWISLFHKPPRRLKRSEAPVSLDGRDSTFPSPVRLIGPINSQSGLGQATRMTIAALASAGVRPKALDFYLDNPASRFSAYAQDQAEGAGIIDVSQRTINLIHLNGESTPLAPAYLDGRLFENTYNIGYFFWELPNPARCHELALELLDEIWVSSDFNAETYRKLTDKPVHKVGMAVEALPTFGDRRADLRSKYGLPANAVVFMSTFDSFSFIKRKNPQATLKAFLQAFSAGDANVVLLIKTHNLTAVLGEAKGADMVVEIVALADEDPRIRIIDETLPYAELIALKSACDCYVSLHRSEGWGFGMLEAMQLGLPVIATAFSGNLEFCTPETAYNVGYKPVFLDRDDYIFVQPGDYWAEPDLAQAADFMRQVYDDPASARARGAAAKSFVQTHFSIEAVGRTYLHRLHEIRAAFGPAAQA